MSSRHLARLGFASELALGIAGTALLVLAAGTAPPDAGEVVARFRPATAMPVSAPQAPALPIVDGPVAAPLPFTPPPVRLELPDVELSASVVPVSTDGEGGLGIPDDRQVLGWWALGAAATQPAGNVVVVGHVDSAEFGRGLFARLPEVPMGATATVTTVTASPTSTSSRAAEPTRATRFRRRSSIAPVRAALSW